MKQNALPLMSIPSYKQETRKFFRVSEGLPSEDVWSIYAGDKGSAYAATPKGLSQFSRGKWTLVGPQEPVRLVASDKDKIVIVTDEAILQLKSPKPRKLASLPSRLCPGDLRCLAVGKAILLGTSEGLYELKKDGLKPVSELNRRLGEDKDIRQIALSKEGRVAVAALSGLFVKCGQEPWESLLPRTGDRSWAPYDVRGVGFDTLGRLWFASPQGVGSEDEGLWTLYTGTEGLPWDDFTCLAPGVSGDVWFGTSLGAIHFDNAHWAYRQGLRWLPDDGVRQISVSSQGAWFATSKGVGLIQEKKMTLAQKAEFYEDEIDQYHRRTPYEYVDGVHLTQPGDKSSFVQHDSDNDGLWTSMYGAGECFAYGATQDPKARIRAKKAFEAMRFLNKVTQGGSHPAPHGFLARTILPTSGPDPNVGRLEGDQRNQATHDALWKIIEPRWPVSEDGQWYWKTDTSSDELDGHYFLYGLYYDLVAETEEEKAEVRQHVTALTNHLLDHDFNLIDHDGLPTRWARFNPKEFNFDKDWWEGRGLNSLSILSYLWTAEHICGSGRYKEAADQLVHQHGYGINLMYPKAQYGMGSGNQSDDEMAFMNYYNLVKYCQDEELCLLAAKSLSLYWAFVVQDLNPLFNFIYALSCQGKTFCDTWGKEPLSPKDDSWLLESVDTLKRIPLDRVNWGLKNSHRKDVMLLPEYARGHRRHLRGYRNCGRVLPADERHIDHWNHDAWNLDQGGSGQGLGAGTVYLLPYYMGLYHGLIAEK